MFPTKLKGKKKTPAGKYVEGLFDIWMFVKSKMHEQLRVNQILICMLGNEMDNLGVVLRLFQIFCENKLFCVHRYTYYCAACIGREEKTHFELILSEAKCKWQVSLSVSPEVQTLVQVAGTRHATDTQHYCCIAAWGGNMGCPNRPGHVEKCQTTYSSETVPAFRQETK